MDVEALKAEAGKAACEYVAEGMNVGLGTGSTVKYTILELGRRVRDEGLNIVGVPTSIATRDLALEVGIPLADLDDLDGLDVVIDGTDEFDPAFQLIKGGGAALLREKVVAQHVILVRRVNTVVERFGDFGVVGQEMRYIEIFGQDGFL